MELRRDHDQVTELLRSVYDEMARQDDKWGGAEHDDQHPTQTFCGWIQNYAGWAAQMSDGCGTEGRTKARRRLVQVAALAVAAVESIDRKWPRATPSQSATGESDGPAKG